MQLNVNLSRMGVTEDIGQRFLKNPEDGRGLFPCQLDVLLMTIAFDDDSRALLELARLPFKGLAQTQFIQSNRPQFRSNLPDGIHRSISQPDHSFDSFLQISEFRLICRARYDFNNLLKVPSQTRQRRSKLIMKLTRNADAFLFSGGLQPG